MTVPQQPSLGAWAVLGLLCEGDTHGWTLVRALAPQGEIGRVWSIPRAIVYRTVGLLVDAQLPMNPGSKGVTSTSVARGVVTAIEKDRGEVDAADAASRIAAKLAGIAPGLTAHLTRRADLVAWGDQVTEALRHLR